MSKVMLIHYITILCKTTWGNWVHVPSSTTFQHLAPCRWHLQDSIHGMLIFLQLQSLLRHPLVHPHDMISEHALGMGGRERSRGTNCPSLWSQPIYVIYLASSPSSFILLPLVLSCIGVDVVVTIHGYVKHLFSMRWYQGPEVTRQSPSAEWRSYLGDAD